MGTAHRMVHRQVLLPTSLTCCLWGRALAEAGCENGFATASCLWFWCVILLMVAIVLFILGCSLRAATIIKQKKEAKREAEEEEAKEEEKTGSSSI
mmetsp:Transcript_19181/g.37688  ORF Transcript_19181/g.37688 Transcript_19181/m.37688 type:complete len:96 (-) Transcript_19181:12-299(-)